MNPPQSALVCRRLKLQHHRNLATQSLEFHPRWNLITGANGSGKTALLEALYLLGRGKSFRSPKPRHWIAHGQSALLLYAEFERLGQRHRVGFSHSGQEFRIHINEQNQPQSALVQLLPVQLINHERLNLALASPDVRRRLLDYGVYYATPDFLPQWQRYQRALKQINAGLRQQWAWTKLSAWYEILAHAGETIHAQRQHYLAQLQSALNHYHHHLGGFEIIELRYQRGYPDEVSLFDWLARQFERDRKQAYLKDGIHRADMSFYADGQNIAQRYSRGEQKTLMSALLLAQSSLIGEQTGVVPMMLVDDLGAELDGERQTLLLQLLQASGAQCFVSHLGALDLGYEHQRFKLERGVCQQSAL